MQRGFSLVEVVVAASLLAAGLAALAQIAAIGIQHGFVATARTTAAILASQKLEELQTLDWASVAALSTEPAEFFDADGIPRCLGDATPCGEAVYIRRVTVRPMAFDSAVLLIAVEAATIGPVRASTTLATARGRLTP